jgi:Tfp pilus assembly protein PilO
MRQKERRLLLILGILVAVAMLFYVFVARGMKGSFAQAQRALDAKQSAYDKLEAARAARKAEWNSWNQALQDMESLRNGYFYPPDTISKDLRRDIAQIFRETGIPVPDIRYSYSQKSDDRIGNGLAIFQISGPYSLIKRFIFGVESFPRFLILEQVDFVDINQATGMLRLKITLAGYYEN